MTLSLNEEDSGGFGTLPEALQPRWKRRRHILKAIRGESGFPSPVLRLKTANGGAVKGEIESLSALIVKVTRTRGPGGLTYPVGRHGAPRGPLQGRVEPGAGGARGPVHVLKPDARR